MIAANKRLLKATLTEGVLQIQSNLIALYTDNLSAMGVQASLIAGYNFVTFIHNTHTHTYTCIYCLYTQPANQPSHIVLLFEYSTSTPTGLHLVLFRANSSAIVPSMKMSYPSYISYVILCALLVP